MFDKYAVYYWKMLDIYSLHNITKEKVLLQEKDARVFIERAKDYGVFFEDINKWTRSRKTDEFVYWEL